MAVRTGPQTERRPGGSGQRPLYRNELKRMEQERRLQLQARTDVQKVPARKARRYYDYSLLFAVIFVFAMGLLVIYSSSQYTAMLERGDAEYYFKRQLLIGGAGLVGSVIISLIDYRWFRRPFFAVAAYAGSCGLMLMTLVAGLASHGKARWIAIAGVSFQPAEVAKIGLIFSLAYYISAVGTRIREPRYLWKAILMSLIPTVLILKQNISSAFIVAMIAAIMLFVALENYFVFFGLGALAIGGMVAAKPLVMKYIEHTGFARPEKYWMRRIVGWAAPTIFEDDAYQTTQGLLAIGSGGMTGHGLGESIQKFGKIPEVQNDMIFTIICEEFGFIGAAAVILLFFYIIYRIYKIAYNASDLFGTMICAGVMGHMGLQVALNIAVVTGVIPNTGVTLPFISYGGSAVFFTMLEIGLVLSVAHRIRTDNV